VPASVTVMPTRTVTRKSQATWTRTAYKFTNSLMPNNTPHSSPLHSCFRQSDADTTNYNMADLFLEDPFDFLPSDDLPVGPGILDGISMPTQMVEDAFKAILERSDGTITFAGPDTKPPSRDRFEVLKETYNDLLRLYRETNSRLEKLTEEHADCKSRLKKLSGEHAELRYVFLIIALDNYLLCSGTAVRMFQTPSQTLPCYAAKL
jgi:hypothetical protein